MRRQRVEAELLDELAKQRVVRKERELVELHARRQSRALEEEKEREAKGEHEVPIVHDGVEDAALMQSTKQLDGDAKAALEAQYEVRGWMFMRARVRKEGKSA